MLRVVINRLKAKAEQLLEEEQAGCRPGRSTVEQIVNSGISTEKHLQTPARSVPQLHRFQESVWQGLACRPVADPKKLQV